YQLLVTDQNIGQTLLAQAARSPRRHPLALAEDRFTSARIPQLAGQLALEPIRIERRHPSLRPAPEDHRAVKERQDFLLGHPNRLAGLQRAILGLAASPKRLS